MTVTESDTRDDVIECLLLLNADARRCTARDNLGRVNQRWVDLHGHLDDLLSTLETMPA